MKVYRKINLNSRKLKRKLDKHIYIRETQNARIRTALKSKGASKNKKTMEYVCCSIEHLYHHLESQFEKGMTWENYGYGDDKWNIEHRRCCDSFDLTDIEQQYMCFHWTNLQPMWQPENFSKGNSFNQATFRYKWWGKEIGWLGIPKYLMPNTSR